MQHESENEIDVERQEDPLVAVENLTSSTSKRPRITSDLVSRKRLLSETVLKIISATYGPSEGRRLLTGELSNDGPASIPFTRDVAPFLKALLMARKSQDEQSEGADVMEEDSTITNSDLGDDGVPDLVRISGLTRHTIPLMDGKQMNAIFGDPCPGTSKRLNIHYLAYESINGVPARASSAFEVHRVTFVEHERVVLRPGVAFYQDDATLQNAVAASASQPEMTRITEESDDGQNAVTLRCARKMGRAQSIAEFAESLSSNLLTEVPSTPAKKWRLRSAASEVTLPIILPFLEVKERVQCKLVCLVWRNVIRYWGVAKTIDVNDDTTFPNFTAPILRGLLAHSHHSLQSLFLGDFQELAKGDLHPAIPYLRKLKNLDISRCNNLDDSTLHLLSEHVSSSLEVLYLKGLRNVTDKGIIAISQACSGLQVLEISNVRITDESGIAIGENMLRLKALYMRDNYLLTNRSVDVITEKCTQLSQLTLWGCTRLRHLSFHAIENDIGCGRLVLLNLWGCHSLADDAAESLGAMRNLRSLIVSECHKLTDVFLFGLAQNIPQLNHLHLRYCKKITERGVKAVANSMHRLFSLDLSFCSRITSAAILGLLEIRQDTLAELRLQNCSHLDITRDLRHHNEFRGNFTGDGSTGRSVLNTLKSKGGQSHLSMLDLRNCGGHQSGQGYPSEDAFVQGMLALGFKQLVPGFFQRPTRVQFCAIQTDLEP